MLAWEWMLTELFYIGLLYKMQVSNATMPWNRVSDRGASPELKEYFFKKKLSFWCLCFQNICRKKKRTIHLWANYFAHSCNSFLSQKECENQFLQISMYFSIVAKANLGDGQCLVNASSNCPCDTHKAAHLQFLMFPFHSEFIVSWTMPWHFSFLSCKGVPGFLLYFHDTWKSVSNVKSADTLLVQPIGLFTHFLMALQLLTVLLLWHNNCQDQNHMLRCNSEGLLLKPIQKNLVN